jgi:mono/diheme cytochrome c family protein
MRWEKAVFRPLRHFILLAVLPAVSALAAEGGVQPVSFRTEIAPLLQRRCAACHCEESAKGGYRLDSFERLQKPGDGGDAPLVAGTAKESVLFKLLLARDPEDRMPQKADALPDAEIALIGRWLDAGAAYDGGDPARPLAELVRETFLRPAPSRYARPVPITALAFNGDGKRLAVNGYREVTIWDPASGTLVRRLGGMPERISALAWHPKRNLLAVAGGTPGQWGSVALVDVSHGYAVRYLCDLPEVVLCVAFDRDGDTLVAGCGDRTMRIFDASSGKQKRVLRQHADWVQAVAFNPKGSRLVSVSRDRTARVFDTATWEFDATYQGHDTPVLAATFTADGSRIYTAARNGGHVWHPEQANKRGDLLELNGDVRQFAAGPFGVAAGCSDGAVRIYQGDGKLPWLTLTGHRDAVQSLAVAPRSEWIASGGADGEVIIWSLDCATWLTRFIAVPK